MDQCAFSVYSQDFSSSHSKPTGYQMPSVQEDRLKDSWRVALISPMTTAAKCFDLNFAEPSGWTGCCSQSLYEQV